MAKLVKTEYIISNGTLIAKIEFDVQGVIYNMECSLQENELLDSATSDGRLDWNTSDVIKITSQKLGQTVSL